MSSAGTVPCRSGENPRRRQRDTGCLLAFGCRLNIEHGDAGPARLANGFRKKRAHGVFIRVPHDRTKLYVTDSTEERRPPVKDLRAPRDARTILGNHAKRVPMLRALNRRPQTALLMASVIGVTNKMVPIRRGNPVLRPKIHGRNLRGIGIESFFNVTVSASGIIHLLASDPGTPGLSGVCRTTGA